MAPAGVAEFTSFDVLEELMLRVQAELEPFVKRAPSPAPQRVEAPPVRRCCARREG